MQNIEIQSFQTSYTVEFFDDVKTLKPCLHKLQSKIFCIDKNLYDLYKDFLDSMISDSGLFLLEATEEDKSLKGVETLLTFLQEKNADKKTFLIAIGGGITQDLVSFCAHIFYRGLEWIFIPSTLLSMADSCIGAKAGINFNKFKNQLGAFHAPSRILICSEFLNSLDDLEIKSGYGEILKLHLISSFADFLDLKTEIEEKGLAKNSIKHLIYKSLLTKKKFIEEDEFDTGIRRVLNYGHSFGHALESMSETYIPHGLAVVWGMNLVNYLAYKKSILSAEKYKMIYDFSNKYFLANLKLKPNPVQLLKALAKDKKVVDKQVNLVFLEDSTKFIIEKTKIDEDLLLLVEEFINSIY